MDLLEIDRLEQALARRPRLAERLFADGERAFAAARGQPARHLAVRFCAKEAVAKALQLRVWDWPDAELMRATDKWAIEERGIAGLELMERAGEGLARVTARAVPEGRIAIVCGKGNNGGDGLVAARHLRRAGRDVDVLLVWPAQWLEGDAATMLERLGGPAPQPFEEAGLKGAHVIVDALLGTGFQGAPRAPADAVIAAINATKARVIAADVPSGV